MALVAPLGVQARSGHWLQRQVVEVVLVARMALPVVLAVRHTLKPRRHGMELREALEQRKDRVSQDNRAYLEAQAAAEVGQHPQPTSNMLAWLAETYLRKWRAAAAQRAR